MYMQGWGSNRSPILCIRSNVMNPAKPGEEFELYWASWVQFSQFESGAAFLNLIFIYSERLDLTQTGLSWLNWLNITQILHLAWRDSLH